MPSFQLLSFVAESMLKVSDLQSLAEALALPRSEAQYQSEVLRPWVVYHPQTLLAVHKPYSGTD
jgi:hypothetical protein